MRVMPGAAARCSCTSTPACINLHCKGLGGRCATGSTHVLQASMGLWLGVLARTVCDAHKTHVHMHTHGRTQACGNCRTTHTPLWRKEGGQQLCNACGIYFKNHGYHRPMELVRAGASILP